MPLSKLQSDILKLLAAQRNPESYVAVASALNRFGTRLSDDIDVFHDLEDGVERAAQADSALLIASGFEVEWVRQFVGIHSVTPATCGSPSTQT